MALAVQTAVSDGTLTTVPVGIEFFSQEDISVYLDLADSPLVAGVDYTWSASSTITFPSALALGVTVFIIRQTQVDEMLNVFDGGAGFTRYTLDENFRQILLLAQEVREGVGLRGVFLPLDMNGYQIRNLGAGTLGTDAVNLDQVQDMDDAVSAAYQAADANIQSQLTGNIPLEASAFSPISWHDQSVDNSVNIPAGKNAWSFGPQITLEEGTAITIGAGSTWTIADGDQQEDDIILNNYVTQAEYAVDQAELINQTGGFVINAVKYGLVAGGDVGAAIQAAHDDGVENLSISPGQYVWTTPVTITTAMQIRGAGFSESPGAGQGTWFQLNTAGATALTFSGSGARGSLLGDCAFWETNHPSEVSGWAPTANDFVIKVLDCYGRVTFDDIFMIRVNKGVYCYNSGRMHFKKITGQWYTNAVTIDKCLDVPAIDYLHHWTFYTSTNVVLQYQQANLDVVTLKRCDGAFLGNIFTFGQRSAIRLSSSVEGIASKIYCNALCTDFSNRSLWIESGANGSNALIAGMTTQGEAWPSTGTGIAGGSAIQVDANDCNVQVGNLHTQRYYDTTVKVTGLRNRIDIGAAWFELSNQANNTSPIVSLADNTSTVAFAGVVRVDNSNSAPLVNANIGSVLSTLMANRGNTSTDELRAFWGSGECGMVALSPNASSDVSVGAKGQNGSVRLKANGKTILRVDDGNGTALADLLLRANAANIQFFAEGSAANIDFALTPKGTGAVIAEKPVKFPGYTFASVPSVSTYAGCTIRITDRNHRLATSDGTNWRFADGTVIA